jgi:hypothetical protein
MPEELVPVANTVIKAYRAGVPVIVLAKDGSVLHGEQAAAQNVPPVRRPCMPSWFSELLNGHKFDRSDVGHIAGLISWIICIWGPLNMG